MKSGERTRGEGHLGQVVDLLSRVLIFLLLFVLHRPKKRKLLWVTDICFGNREEMKLLFIKQTDFSSALIMTENRTKRRESLVAVGRSNDQQ